MDLHSLRQIPVAQLALRLAGRKDIDVSHILRQVEGWQRLRNKVPSWAEIDDLEYPPRLALEQCSGEKAARYKAQLVRRLLSSLAPCDQLHTMADLTGGLGVDFSQLAPLFGQAVYVERQEELCRLARHNFPLLGLTSGVEIVCDEAEHYLERMAPADLIFLDPARRDTTGHKMVSIADCQPDLISLLPGLRAKARFIVVKLSPMLDIKGALRSLGDTVTEVHVISRGGECKDLLLVISGASGESCAAPKIIACDDGRTFVFTLEEEREAEPPLTARIGSYLYEPGPALLKAGAFRLIATRFGLSKLHPDTHLYTAERCVDNFPGRTFRVERVYTFAKADLKALRQDTGGHANLTVRNFPMSVATLRKKLRLTEGGDAYLFATTLQDGSHALIRCEKHQAL